MENTANFQRSSPLRKPIRPRRRPSRVTTSTPIANHEVSPSDTTMCDFLALKSFHCTARMPSLTNLDKTEQADTPSEDQRFFRCDRSLLLESCRYGTGRLMLQGPARQNEVKKKVGSMRRHVTNVVAKALHLQQQTEVKAGSTRRMSYMRLF